MPDGTGKAARTQARRDAQKPRRQRTPGLMALEPRLMYDAAAAVTLAAAATNPTHAAATQSGSTTAASGDHGQTASAAPPPDASNPSHAAVAPANAVLFDASDPTHAAVAPTTAPPAVETGSSSSGGNSAITQLVFIDGNTPDAQTLANGVQPGVQAVILNTNSDGMQQIATYLQQNHFQNLDAVSIVAHGTTDELALGNSLLTAADAPHYSAQLATIGQALKPGGDILLYGCDVAQVNNDPLLGELASETGGATVAAASHLVGASALGGSWNLDISTGAVTAATPFTDAALQAYPDLLTISSSLLWYTANNNSDGAGAGVFHTVAGGTTNETSTITGVATNSSSTVIGDGAGLAVDAADGYYFVVDQNGGTSHNLNEILRGQIGSSTLTVIYTSGAGQAGTGTGSDPLFGLAYDAVNGTLYFSQEDSADGAGITTTDTGIYALAHANQATVGSVTKLVDLNSGTQQVNEIALDIPHNLLFFTDGLTNLTTVNNLEVANLTTGSVLNNDLAAATLSSTQTMSGVSVDPTTDTILWTVTDSGSNSGNTIHSATYSTSGTPSLSSVTQLYSGSSQLSTGQAPFDIAIDGSTFYVLTSQTAGGASATAQILEGNVSGSGSLSIVDTPTNGGTVTSAYALTLEAQPTIVANGTVTNTEGQAANTIDTGVTVSTVNGAELDGATVQISNFQTGDVLGVGSSANFTLNGSQITFSDGDTVTFSGGSTGTLTFTGVGTAADYQHALAAVTFSSTSTNVTARTIDWTVNDRLVASGTAASTVQMGPAVAPSGATATFDGGSTGVALDPGLVVGDGSSATLASATITIAGGFLTGDTLSVAASALAGTGISAAAFDTTNHDLVLTGTSSVANYKAVLDAVQYSTSPSNTDPTNGGADTSRTIQWVVSDGTLTSTAKTSTLDTVHTAPTMSASGTVTFNGGGSAVTLDSTAAVTDPDSGGNLASATVSIGGGTFVNGDTLSVSGVTNGTVVAGTNITLNYTAGTGVLTLTGSDTLAHYDTVLDEVQYSFSPSNGDPTAGGGHTSRTIDWSANDGGPSNGTSNTATSTLDTVHVAPALTVGSPSVNYTAGGSPTVLDGGLSVSDVDSNGDLASATITISSGFLTGDTLSAVTTGTGITATAFNTTTHQLVLSGSDTVAHYQQVLDSVAYSSSNADPTNGGADTTRGISWLINDGSTSNGTASGSTSVGVHLGPAITAGATVTYDSGGAAIPLDGSLTISDGASTTITGATVAISSGAFTGDTLSFNGGTNSETFGDGATVTATFGSNTLTLSTTAGTASVADYQAAFDAVTYSSSASDATNAGGSLTRTITWSATDGGGHTGSATSTLDVRTPPVVDAGAPSVTFVTGGSAVAADPDVTLSDVESTTLAGATVQLTNFQSGDVLGVGSGAGFTVSGSQVNFTDGHTVTFSGGSTGTMSLSGTATTADYQAALDAVSFTTSGAGATNPSRTIDWNVTDGLATSNTAASSLTVHVPPTAGAVSVTGGVEGTTPAALSATFTDANASAVASDFSGTITWGDGSTTNFTSASVSGSGGSFTVSGLSHLYAQEGAFSASVTINDAGGGTVNESGTANVADAPLTAGAVTLAGGVEGTTPTTLSATFTDANIGATASDFTGTIAWGDGQTSVFTAANVSGAGGSFTVSGLSHLYAEDGSHTTTVTINDVGGSSATDTGTASVADAALTAGTATVTGGVEGTTAAALSATFTDANLSATASDFSGTIAWGDGQTTNFTNANVSGAGGSFTVSGLSHAYAQEGSYSTSVTINDVGGSTATDSGTATIADAPLAAGAVTVSGGVEGITPAALSATFTDANAGAAASDFSGTIAWGDGQTSNFTSANVSGSGGSFTVSGLSHLYAQDGAYTAHVTINDLGGSSTTETGSTTVADAPLSAGTATLTGGVEGSAATTLSATFTDANAAAATSDFSGTVAWGDGATTNFTSAAVSGSNGSFTVSGLTHVYAEDGNHTATVTISDVGGSTATDTGTASVADAALTAGAVTVSGSTEQITAATLSATFTDANAGALATDFSGTIAWGDGQTTNFTNADVSGAAGSFTVSGVSHTYAEQGGYTTTVTINDVGGSTTTDTGSASVADAALTAGTATVNGGVEGTTSATLSATFTDANAAAPTSDFSGTVAWGDGTTTSFTSADVSGAGGSYTVSGLTHLYAEEGTYSTSVTINDLGGSTTTDTGSTNVADAPLTAGTVTVSGGVEGGTAATLSAGFTDANTGATASDFSGTIAWGDGTTTNFTNAAVSGAGGNFTVSGLSHAYAEEGTYATSVTINDLGGSTTTDTGSTNVADAPLTAGTMTVSGGVEGTTAATLSATFSDANASAPTADFSGTITWGDGTTTNFTGGDVTANGGGSFTVSGLSHAYAEDGTFSASVAINDTGGSSATDTGSTHVADAPLTAGAVTVNGGAAGTTAATVSATFTDANAGAPAADFSGTIAWGDGATTSFTSGDVTANGGGSFTVSGLSHLYALSGSYTTSVTIDDVGGSTATETGSATVAHVAPTVAAGGTVTFDGGGGPVVLDSTASVTDPDSGGNLASATVSIAGGFISGDVLSVAGQSSGVISGTNITVAYDGAGKLTLTGSDTIADYKTALDEVAYGFSPANGDPTAGGGHTSRTIDWSANDGDSGNGASNTATSTLDTVHVAPTVSAGGTVTFGGGGAPVALDSTLTVNDVDSGGNLAGATVTISSGFLAGDTLAATTAGTSITASYDSTHGVLTLSGADTLTHYQGVLRSVTFGETPSNNDPTAGGDTSRTISWTVNDGSTSNGTSNAATSTVDTVHAAPVVTTGFGITLDSFGTAVPADPFVRVSDTDSPTLAGATVAITSGHLSGDTLDLNHGANSESFADGKTISASFNNGAGILTLSGTASLADYQLALRNVEFNTNVNATSLRTVSWSVNDGSGASGRSATATSSLLVIGAPPLLPPPPFHEPPPPPGPHLPPPPFQPPSLPQVPEPPGVVIGELPGFGGPVTLAGLEPQAGGGEFVALLDGIPDFTVDGDQHFEFTIPHDAFMASAGDSGIAFGASLADGNPLPPWLSFDSATGKFVGNPPQGESATFTIEVLVHDAGGHAAAATFHLSVGQGHASVEPVPPPAPHAAVEPAPDRHAALAPRDPGLPGHAHLRLAADNDRWHHKDVRHEAALGADAAHAAAGIGDRHGASTSEAHPVGKPGLLAQLRAAGHHGFTSERQALLDSLQRRAVG